MLPKIKAFWNKHREVLMYLIFGGLTTVVDWVVSYLLYFWWGAAIEERAGLIHVANTIAWAAAVTFAYLTNRRWVFESTRKGLLPILGEFASFAGGRVLTLLLQEAMFVVFFHWLGISEFIVKIIAAVLVVIANYFISKLLVFKKEKT